MSDKPSSDRVNKTELGCGCLLALIGLVLVWVTMAYFFNKQAGGARVGALVWAGPVAVGGAFFGLAFWWAVRAKQRGVVIGLTIGIALAVLVIGACFAQFA